MALFDFLSRKKEPLPLPYTTDIHSHILPGVDDGSPNVETSLFLVENMAKWGIKQAIATPHVTEGKFENTPDILDPALEELQSAVASAGIGIDIIRSSENRIDDFFRQQLQAGLITTFPNNYILVENSFMQEAIMLDKFLFDLKVNGFHPILAHPERYFYYHEQPERYSQLHRAGNLFQVNILSLAGAYGREEKRAAEKLIEKGFVDFLATDLHSPYHVEIIDAYLRTKDARRHFEALTGRLLNDRLFTPRPTTHS